MLQPTSLPRNPRSRPTAIGNVGRAGEKIREGLASCKYRSVQLIRHYIVTANSSVTTLSLPTPHGRGLHGVGRENEAGAWVGLGWVMANATGTDSDVLVRGTCSSWSRPGCQQGGDRCTKQGRTRSSESGAIPLQPFAST
jgi:hypothetical protein